MSRLDKPAFILDPSLTMAALFNTFAFVLLLLLPAMSSVASGTEVKQPEVISWRHHASIFPSNWLKRPFFAEASPLRQSQRQRALRIVTKALNKYPQALLDRTLNKVYLVGDLRFFKQQQFAGTASASAIYIVVKEPQTGYSDAFIEATVHREYSSLLLNRHLHAFDQSSWHAINPQAFNYGGSSSWQQLREKGGGAKAIDAGKTSLALQKQASHLNYGFLTEYSTSSLENDFNEYAAAIFTNNPDFYALLSDNPAVKQKWLLAVAFYAELDNQFNTEYFQTLEH